MTSFVWRIGNDKETIVKNLEACKELIEELGRAKKYASDIRYYQTIGSERWTSCSHPLDEVLNAILDHLGLKMESIPSIRLAKRTNEQKPNY